MKCVAVCCSVLQGVAVWWRVMSHVICMNEVCCSVLQCVAGRCSMMACDESCHLYEWFISRVWIDHVICKNEPCHSWCCCPSCPVVCDESYHICANEVCCSVLQCVAVCCSVLQCVAVCCSVLQCAAVCCSKLSNDGVWWVISLVSKWVKLHIVLMDYVVVGWCCYNYVVVGLCCDVTSITVEELCCRWIMLWYQQHNYITSITIKTLCALVYVRV